MKFIRSKSHTDATKPAKIIKKRLRRKVNNNKIIRFLYLPYAKINSSEKIENMKNETQHENKNNK